MPETREKSCTNCGYPAGHSSSCEQHKKIVELDHFLDEIDALDQQDPGRKYAPECYARLKAREPEFIGTELEKLYWNAVSFELFHMFQNAALIDSTDENAQRCLEEAQTTAKKGFSKEWLAYIQGVVHYFEGNTSALEAIRDDYTILDDSDKNKIALTRLLNGLERRGTPHYREDY